MSEKKLVEYMSKFGELEDCIVIKERSTGRSRGFGYVTFATIEDAKSALSHEHIPGNRVLDVKVATPKGMRTPAKKVTKIFVARIPPSVSEAAPLEDSVDDLMSETHELRGSNVVVDRATPKFAIDSAAPVDDAGSSGGLMDTAEPYGGYGPKPTYGRMYGIPDFDDWGYGPAWEEG